MVNVYNKLLTTGVGRGLQPRCSSPLVRFGFKTASALPMRAYCSTSTPALCGREKRPYAIIQQPMRAAYWLLHVGIYPMFLFAYNLPGKRNNCKRAVGVLRKSFSNYSCKYEINMYLCAQVENNNYKPLKKNQNGKNNNHRYAHRS